MEREFLPEKRYMLQALALAREAAYSYSKRILYLRFDFL